MKKQVKDGKLLRVKIITVWYVRRHNEKIADRNARRSTIKMMRSVSGYDDVEFVEVVSMHRNMPVCQLVEIGLHKLGLFKCFVINVLLHFAHV